MKSKLQYVSMFADKLVSLEENCAGSLLDSVGYSHLNLLRTGSKKPRLQLLHSSPKTRDLARHTQNTP